MASDDSFARCDVCDTLGLEEELAVPLLVGRLVLCRRCRKHLAEYLTKEAGPMTSDGGGAGQNRTPHRVDLNLLCGGEVVERLTFKEGESFGAEVHSDEFEIEVVNIE